jgi:multidrug efflux pump subunit AcrB
MTKEQRLLEKIEQALQYKDTCSGVDYKQAEYELNVAINKARRAGIDSWKIDNVLISHKRVH